MWSAARLARAVTDARAAAAAGGNAESTQGASHAACTRDEERARSSQQHSAAGAAGAAGVARDAPIRLSWRPRPGASSCASGASGMTRQRPEPIERACSDASVTIESTSDSSAYPSSSTSSVRVTQQWRTRQREQAPTLHANQRPANQGSSSRASESTANEHDTGSNTAESPDGDDGDSECAVCESESNDDDAPRLYGASGRNPSKRMRVELDVRASLRAQRPSHAQFAAVLLDPEAIKAIVTGEHRCRNLWLDDGEEVQCHHRLWSRGIPAAIAALMEQRKRFLACCTKDRGDAVYTALAFEDALQLHGPSGWSPPVRKVVFRVGLMPGSERVVCREIFLAHYPVSLSTLKRIVARKRLGAELYVKLNPLLQQHRISNKTCHVLSWWLEYAKQVR